MNIENSIRQIIIRSLKSHDVVSNDDIDALNTFLLEYLNCSLLNVSFPKISLGIAQKVLVPPLSCFIMNFCVQHQLCQTFISEVNKEIQNVRHDSFFYIGDPIPAYIGYLKSKNQAILTSEDCKNIINFFLRDSFASHYRFLSDSTWIGGFAASIFEESFSWDSSHMGERFWAAYNKKFIAYMRNARLYDIFELYITAQNDDK